jgi:hypothetical protein
MSDTLRSLVLRYTADTKDFSKGTEKVKSELKSMKSATAEVDKALGKMFAKPVSESDALRNHIRQLNSEFASGAMKARAYGDAIAQASAKLQSLKAVESVRASEKSAIIRNAMIGKDLADNYRGSMGESREALIARMNGAKESSGGSPLSGLPGGGLLGGLGKFAGAAGLGYSAFKVFEEGKRQAAEKANQPFGTRDHAAGSVMSDAYDTIGNIVAKPKELAGRGLNGLLENSIDFLSGGAITDGMRSQREALAALKRVDAMKAESAAKDYAREPLDTFNKARDQQQALEKMTEQQMLAARSAAMQTKDYDEARRLNEAIVDQKRQQIELDKQAKQLADEKAAALTNSLLSMQKQLDVAKLVNGGMEEAAAAMKVSGGSRQQIEDAGRISKELRAEQEKKRLHDDPGTPWLADMVPGINDMLDDAITKAKEVTAFQQRFETPKQRFGRTLADIGRMKGLGASPESLTAAMRANAREFIGQKRSLDPFAPDIEAGSAAAARALHAARFERAGQSDKAIDKLLKVQEDALKALKDGLQMNVTVQEINL